MTLIGSLLKGARGPGRRSENLDHPGLRALLRASRDLRPRPSRFQPASRGPDDLAPRSVEFEVEMEAGVPLGLRECTAVTAVRDVTDPDTRSSGPARAAVRRTRQALACRDDQIWGELSPEEMSPCKDWSSTELERLAPAADRETSTFADLLRDSGEFSTPAFQPAAIQLFFADRSLAGRRFWEGFREKPENITLNC